MKEYEMGPVKTAVGADVYNISRLFLPWVAGALAGSRVQEDMR
jgi:hypothetical protein